MKTFTKTLVSLATMACVAIAPSLTHAQTTGSTIVTVTVADVMALVVAVPAVPIAMGSISEFTNGNSFMAPLQLVASSNRPYDINVTSTNLDGLTSGVSIPISNITIGSAVAPSTTFNSELPLSTGTQVFLSNEAPAMAKTYNVKYTAKNNTGAFFVKGDAYKATVTYSITAHQ